MVAYSPMRGQLDSSELADSVTSWWQAPAASDIASARHSFCWLTAVKICRTCSPWALQSPAAPFAICLTAPLQAACVAAQAENAETAAPMLTQGSSQTLRVVLRL